MRSALTEGLVILCHISLFRVVGSFNCHNIQDCVFFTNHDLYLLSSHWECGLVKCLRRSNCSVESDLDHVNLVVSQGFLSTTKLPISNVSYANVTLSYSEEVLDSDRERTFFIYEEGNDGQCWEVTPGNSPSNPLVVPFLPYRRQLRLAQHSRDKECVALGKVPSASLERLKDDSKRDTLYFSMPQLGSDKISYELLHSANCCLTCNGSLNLNSHVNVVYSGFNDPTAPNFKVVNQLLSLRLNVSSSGFYCMRIGFLHCLRHTNTIHVNINDDDGTIANIYKIGYPTYPYLLLFLVGVTIVTAAITVVGAIRKKKKIWMEGSRSEKSALHCQPIVRDPKLKSEIQVLLVYPFTPEHCDLMKCFNHYIKSFNIQVWDPYTDENAEVNLQSWLIEIFSIPYLRIILVESKDSEEVARSHLEGYVRIILKKIYTDFGNELWRIFIIRFDVVADNFQKGIPNKRYRLPDDLLMFMNNLLGASTESEYVLQETMIQDEDLLMAISKFKNNVQCLV